MTGFAIRVELEDGTAADRDIDQLTDDQLRAFVESRRPDDTGWQWVVGLARWIRDNVKENGDVLQEVQGEVPALQGEQGTSATRPVLDVLLHPGDSGALPDHE